MSDRKQLPHELDFIMDPCDSYSRFLRSAEWVNSKFDEPVWATHIGRNGKRNTIIDFRVRLDDGLLLTHPKHQNLLETIKW